MGYYFNPKIGLNEEEPRDSDVNWVGLIIIGGFVLIAILARLFR